MNSDDSEHIEIESIDALTGEIVEREAPEERNREMEQLARVGVLGSVMTKEQQGMLLRQTPKWAIKKRQGPGGKALSYVEHGYVTDTLNKLFGFDWDLNLLPIEGNKMYSLQIEEVFDLKGKLVKTNRHIAVAGELVVRLHDPDDPRKVIATIRKSGFGSQLWLPTTELGDAIKGARSDLIKTCAFQLGIALDLYWNEEAELEEYQRKEEEKEQAIEARKAAEEKAQIEELAKAKLPPANGVILIARAMTEKKLNADQVAEKSGMDLGKIMSASPEEIAEIWNKL